MLNLCNLCNLCETFVAKLLIIKSKNKKNQETNEHYPLEN